MGLCPITEYASAWVAEPATGLFHDASRAVCCGCFTGESRLLALTPSFGSTDPTHGFRPCARCLGTAGLSSHAGGSKVTEALRSELLAPSRSWITALRSQTPSATQPTKGLK